MYLSHFMIYLFLGRDLSTVKCDKTTSTCLYQHTAVMKFKMKITTPSYMSTQGKFMFIYDLNKGRNKRDLSFMHCIQRNLSQPGLYHFQCLPFYAWYFSISGIHRSKNKSSQKPGELKTFLCVVRWCTLLEKVFFLR